MHVMLTQVTTHVSAQYQRCNFDASKNQHHTASTLHTAAGRTSAKLLTSVMKYSAQDFQKSYLSKAGRSRSFTHMSCVSLPASFICCNSFFGLALLHLLRSSSLKISGVANPMGGLTRSRGVSRGKGDSTSSTTSPLHGVTVEAVGCSQIPQRHMMCVSADFTCQCNMQHHWRRRWTHQNQSLLTI